jgi:hypothetical protein
MQIHSIQEKGIRTKTFYHIITTLETNYFTSYGSRVGPDGRERELSIKIRYTPQSKAFKFITLTRVRLHPLTFEPKTKSNNSISSDSTCLEAHIDAYFNYVYPIPSFSFLQRALFVRDFKDGECASALLRAVCAAGSIFLAKNEIEKQRRDTWIEEAEIHVLKKLDEPNLVNIQVLLLLTFVYSALRKPRKILFLLSIASRMAYLNRLNYEREELPFMLRETRRRTMWALCMQDTFYAAGLPEFTTCAVKSIHVKLPSSETAFAMDIEEESEYLRPLDEQTSRDTELGILAYYVRLLDIRDRILRFVVVLNLHVGPTLSIVADLQRA